MQHKDNTVLKYIYKSKLGDIEIFVNEDYLFALFFSDSNTFDTTLIKNHETISNNYNPQNEMLEKNKTKRLFL